MRSRILIAVAAIIMVAATAYCQTPPQPTTVGDLLALHYGVPNAIIVHRQVTVGTSPTQLTVDDSSRFADVFADLGTSSCTLAHSPSVSSTFGFPLAISGVITEEWRDDMTLPTYTMWAVCGSASQTIDVVELKLP